MHSHSRNRILIMEDDAPLVRLYRDVLQHSGYEVYEASQFCIVQEFMKLDSPIHLFICSINPGHEARLESIRQMGHNFQKHGTHIIVMNNLGYPITEKLDRATIVHSFSSIRDFLSLVKQNIHETSDVLRPLETCA